MNELVVRMTQIDARLNELEPKAQNGTLTAEERAEIVNLQAEAETAEAEIRAVEKLKNRKKDSAAAAARNNPEAKLTKAFSVIRAARKLTGQDAQLVGAEREVHEEAVREGNDTGVHVPGNAVGIPSFVHERMAMAGAAQRAALNAGTAATASNLIATELYDMVPALAPKPMLGMLGATVLSGLKGNVEIPAGDAVASAAFATETGAAAETVPTTKLVSLTPKRLAAWTGITLQMMNQSSISMDAWVGGELTRAEARKIDSVGILGGGSNEPTGIIGNANTQVHAMGPNGAVLTRAALLQLETLVSNENADDASMNFLTTPGIKGFLKNLLSASAVGPFVWTDDNTILGYGAHKSTLVPSTLTKGSASSICHAVIYGDFSKLIIGNWGVRYLTVDNVTQARAGQIELVLNSFWDTAIVHPKGFAVIKDALLS